MFDMATKIKNTYIVECFEHVHPDGSICRIPADRRGNAWVGNVVHERGCPQDVHTPRSKWKETVENLTVTVGLNKLLDSTFKTGATSPTWYLGLVNNASFSAYAAGDTMSSHVGWLEGTPYSNSTRPAWTPGAISGGSVDNSGSVATFNINATLTLRGGFIVNDNTKGGSTGTLYGEGDFGAAQPVISGNTVQFTCTLTAVTA